MATSERLTTDQIWTAVHHERAQLVRDLADLEEHQWDLPTACPGWTVHDVLAHLVDTARMGRWRFVRDLVAARFDFDRANDRGIARARRDSPQQTLRDLADAEQLSLTPPAAPATRLVEAYVHGEDIRRALGRTGVGDYDPEAVTEALRYQAKTSVSFGGGRERVAGICMQPDDVDLMDLPIGDGLPVSGTALSLLLAVSGRAVGERELTGAGASQLRSKALA